MRRISLDSDSMMYARASPLPWHPPWCCGWYLRAPWSHSKALKSGGSGGCSSLLLFTHARHLFTHGPGYSTMVNSSRPLNGVAVLRLRGQAFLASSRKAWTVVSSSSVRCLCLLQVAQTTELATAQARVWRKTSSSHPRAFFHAAARVDAVCTTRLSTDNFTHCFLSTTKGQIMLCWHNAPSRSYWACVTLRGASSPAFLRRFHSFRTYAMYPDLPDDSLREASARLRARSAAALSC
mmetsp:Transcript_63942/g.147250  ORF Transcript_63942/g.147250 Transcript_63942/m.147250 type:complete len:237 (-) Transcript_63942:362-1072(-)